MDLRAPDGDVHNFTANWRVGLGMGRRSADVGALDNDVMVPQAYAYQIWVWQRL